MRTLSFIFEMGVGPSLIFSLTALVTGLMIPIALVVIRPALGGGRARRLRARRVKRLQARRQAEARFQGGNQQVQRRADQMGEPLAPTEPPASPMLEKEVPRIPASLEPPGDCQVKLEVASLTHPGIKRQYKPNEDSLFALEGICFQGGQPQCFGLFVVADGMGGHLNGQEASQLGIQTMVDRVLPTLWGNGELKEADFRHLLIEGVLAANRVIYQRNQEQRTTMGTTIIAALVVDDTAFVANVGDSRTYLYRATEGLRQITKDHSVVAYLVEHGIIQSDAIYTHPQRNRVYRSLGSEAILAVDTFTKPLQPGDTLLLCSDGLWEMVLDPIIEQIMREGTDPSQTSRALLQAALAGGGVDNISVIVVQISQTTRGRDVAGLHLLAKPDTVELPYMGQNKLKQSS
jgi:serine/threonine protein phosphatase PrpC